MSIRDKALRFKKSNPKRDERIKRFGDELGWDECKVEFIIWAEGTSLDLSGIHTGEPIFRPAICAWEGWKAAWNLKNAAAWVI